MLDTQLGVETPEGVQLILRPAGPVVRFAAFGIDLGIRLGIYLALSIAFSPFGKLGGGLFLISVFLVEWFYPVVFEILRSGATPGKKAMGIAVVEDNGLPVSPSASIVRNLLRFADFLPFLYGFGIASVLLTRDFKRLGDLAAGTQVVYREKRAGDRALPEAPPRALKRALDSETQLALVGLAERSRRLTPERLDELLALAARVSDRTDAASLPPDALKTRIFGVAQWLIGRR
jgi:uncharacterized RDD family membrane protein YckC